MKAVKGRKYHVDYHEGPDYTHFQGEAKCIDSKPVLLDSDDCYSFEIPGEEGLCAFPESAIIRQIKERKKGKS